MTRQTFLTLTSLLALAIALFALVSPHTLLLSKGVTPSAATVVWVREVGVLILAAGCTTLLSRRAPDSSALRAVLWGNALLHLSLLPIELVAFAQGVIPKASGVVPNSVLHVLLALGFSAYACRVELPPASAADVAPR